jgi:RNA polymerase sigma-70 factor, ECF subfamily
MEKVVLAGAPLTYAGAIDFDALVQVHAHFVFKVAYAVLRNPEDAEEVVQDTFFRAYQSGEAGNVKRMRAWLARIAWRLAVDRVRQRSGNGGKRDFEDSPELLPARDPSAEESLLQTERLAILDLLLSTLSRDLRETLQLSTVEGMASAEIAEVLGIPASSVRDRLSRARKLVKQKLAALTEGSYGS